MYANKGDGIYKYNGSEWILTDGPANTFRLSISASGNIYAGGDDVWKLNGDIWESLGAPVINGEKQRVRDVLESQNGIVYAAAAESGVWEYRAGKWVNISAAINENHFGAYYNFERATNARLLLEDKSGNIYLGTYGGIWKYNDGESWTCITASLSTVSNYIYSMIEGLDGNIYMCAGNSIKGGGIWKYDENSWSSMNANLVGQIKTVFSFVEKASGTVYAGSPEGIWEKTPKGWVDISGDMTSLSNDTWIQALLEDNNGNLLAGTGSSGVWRYNGRAWENISGEMDGKKDSIHTMIKSKDGTIYIGSERGLWKYSDNKITRVPGMDMGVQALLEDNGILYMTCYTGLLVGKGMWTYDGVKFTNITAYLSDKDINMRGLLKAKDGNIYTVTENGWLWSYNRAEWKKIEAYPAEEIRIRNYVNLVEDGSGNIYVTAQNGLFIYDGTEWTKFASGQIPESKPHIWGFMETENGLIYMGVNGGGILTGKPPKATPQSVTDKISQSVPQSGGHFTDVQSGAWYADAVGYVSLKGLMVGTSGTIFGPSTTLTRAMIVTILYRQAGEPDVSALANHFDDVPKANGTQMQLNGPLTAAL